MADLVIETVHTSETQMRRARRRVRAAGATIVKEFTVGDRTITVTDKGGNSVQVLRDAANIIQTRKPKVAE